MRMRILVLAIAAVSMTACSTPKTTADLPYSAQPPVVHPITQVIPLGPTGGRAPLAESKRQAIFAAIEMLSPADAVHVSIAVPPGDDSLALEDELRGLVKYAGVPSSQITVVFSEPGKGANVAVTSYVLSPAACNAWFQPVDGDFDNRPHPGLGCVVNRNLYLMIADPRDLMVGRAED